MLSGIRAFVLLSCGQFVSSFGSGLSRFALALWIYEQTGQATQYALALFFGWLPELLFSPIAGALVDRWDRRRALILSDGGLALATLIVALLLATDQLEIWHIYATNVVGGLFGAFQWPAYSASVTMLVPKQQLGRANGLAGMSVSTGNILAPMCSVVLVKVLGIHGVLLIDCVTFLFALTAVAIIRIPRPEKPPIDSGHAYSADAKTSLLKEIKSGFSFIWKRPGLIYLLLFLGFVNLCVGFHNALSPALLLGFASAGALATVAAASSAGMLAGGALMTFSGGSKRKMNGILGFGLLYALGLGAIGLRPSVQLIAAATFVTFFSVPLINGCSQVIWQSKVPPGLQGRVFAARKMTAQATLPLSFLVAGPLADHIFNPLLEPGGALEGSLGPLLGTGAGRGIGVIFLILGFLGIITTLRALFAPRLLNVETELPDFTD